MRTGVACDFRWAGKANAFGDEAEREGGTEGESLAGVLVDIRIRGAILYIIEVYVPWNVFFHYMPVQDRVNGSRIFGTYY